MTVCVSFWMVWVPVIAVQYALAIGGLLALARRDPPKTEYVIWNIVILVVIFAGSIAFFIYNAVCPRDKRKKAETEKAPSPSNETEVTSIASACEDGANETTAQTEDTPVERRGEENARNG